MLLSAFTYRLTPTLPTGDKYIEISMQLPLSYVVEVHRHLPSIHAPFLLQWYGQVFLFLQTLSKFLGQTNVPVIPGGGLRICPGVLQTRIELPTLINKYAPVLEHVVV